MGSFPTSERVGARALPPAETFAWSGNRIQEACAEDRLQESPGKGHES